jgi:hypothetical protein
MRNPAMPSDKPSNRQCINTGLREAQPRAAQWHNPISDYKKRRTGHDPILIDGAVVKQVESFKFLGVYITNKLSWAKNAKTVVKRPQQNLFSPGDWKDLAWVLRSSKSSTAAWYDNCSALTTRHYRGYCVRPSTSMRPSSLQSRTSIPGSVKGRL